MRIVRRWSSLRTPAFVIFESKEAVFFRSFNEMFPALIEPSATYSWLTISSASGCKPDTSISHLSSSSSSSSSYLPAIDRRRAVIYSKACSNEEAAVFFGFWGVFFNLSFPCFRLSEENGLGGGAAGRHLQKFRLSTGEGGRSPFTASFDLF